nr:MAG TPA: hypothetical protein [Caudoviricetes sp.]
MQLHQQKESFSMTFSCIISSQKNCFFKLPRHAKTCLN